MEWTNEEVRVRIRKVVDSENENLVVFLRCLIQIEKNELFLEDGFSRIHDYCERSLGLCRGTTLKRVWVARAASRFPVLLDYLGSGRLNLTNVSHLVRHLTEDNHLSLLEEAVGKKESELKWWLARLFPNAVSLDTDLNGQEKIIPLDGKKAKCILVVDEEFVDLLTRSRQVHKHKYPDGNALEILKRGMREDLKNHDPIEKAKRARKPKAAAASTATAKKNGATQPKLKIASRGIPAGISYKVEKKQSYQCNYVSPQGVRCEEKAGVEHDHCRSWAKGGDSTEENIQLLCFAHNRWKARKEFGKDFRKKKAWFDSGRNQLQGKERGVDIRLSDSGRNQLEATSSRFRTESPAQSLPCKVRNNDHRI